MRLRRLPRSSLLPAHLLPTLQLMYHAFCAVNIAQRLHDATRIHADGAAHLVAILKIPGQRLDIAVEDNAHYFGFAVQGWTAGVAADDVRCVNEIQRSVEFYLRLLRHPAFRQD